MKERFFYYHGWYYPIASVSFRMNMLSADDFTISMFHLSEAEAVEIFKGKEAKQVEALLDTLSLDLELLEEEQGNG